MLVLTVAGVTDSTQGTALGMLLQVKRLPDMGSPSDSKVVRGVVAKKNVAHRRMRTDIQQPCVALLSGALEYQRVANKLSSFDTLLEQEREHLRLAVARIAAAK